MDLGEVQASSIDFIEATQPPRFPPPPTGRLCITRFGMCGPVALVRERLPTDHGPWVDRLLGRIAAREVTPRQASPAVFEFLWPGRWAFARRVAKGLESYRRK